MKIRFLIAGAALMLATLAAAPTSYASRGYVSVVANLYAGPADDYPVLGPITPRNPIEVFGCLDGYSWCEVGAGTYRGWVPGEYVVYPAYGQQVVISQAPIFVPIISFSIVDYWHDHYRAYPFYQERYRWYPRHVQYDRPVHVNNIIVHNNNVVVHDNSPHRWTNHFPNGRAATPNNTIVRTIPNSHVQNGVIVQDKGAVVTHDAAVANDNNNHDDHGDNGHDGGRGDFQGHGNNGGGRRGR